MTAQLAVSPARPMTAVRPEDMQPPRGVQSFSIVMRLGHRHAGQRSVRDLTDEQLAWCLRTLEAETQRRATERRERALFVQSTHGRLAIVPEDGLQFVLF